MALSDFTNPKNPWKIKTSTYPSHCHEGEFIELTVTLTCSVGHSLSRGTYDPKTDSISFANGCKLTREIVGEKTEITCTYPDYPQYPHHPVVTGSWTADDSGNAGGGGE